MIKLKYENFEVEFPTKADYEKARMVKTYLESGGFVILGWSANEGLYTTGAWKETENWVFCISDAEPFDDGVNGIVHPDPFNMPSALNNECSVTLYRKPFKPFYDPSFRHEDSGEEWKMDGTPPVAVNEDNREVLNAHFLDIDDAMRFCEFIEAETKG